MFDFDLAYSRTKEFIIKHSQILLIGLCLVIIMIDSVRISRIETLYENTNLRLDTLQTTLGVSEAPDTGRPVVNRGPLSPVIDAKVLIPIIPDNVSDVAKIAEGYTRMDNYYPTNTPLVYIVSDSIDTSGSAYSKKLLNSGWQIQGVQNNTAKEWEKAYIQSFSATNGQSIIQVSMSDTLEGYDKDIGGGSFIEVVIQK